MWIRAELKDRAKRNLRSYYWLAVGVGLLTLIIAGSNVGTSSISFSYRATADISDSFYYDLGYGNLILIPMLWPFIAFFGGVIVLALSILVSGPISLGYNYFFLRGAQEDVNFRHLFHGFTNGFYTRNVGAMFQRSLYIFLWSLLFIIPGIVKSYEYKFVAYILAENPGMTGSEAIALSREMTNGHKWDMFVLDWSFILWDLLAGILVIGHLFLNPYKEATYAQLYLTFSPRPRRVNYHHEETYTEYL